VRGARLLSSRVPFVFPLFFRALKHWPSDTIFLFRPYEESDRVKAGELWLIRKVLDERGLLEPESFETLLTKPRHEAVLPNDAATAEFLRRASRAAWWSWPAAATSNAASASPTAWPATPIAA
jgi:hypothetical protein